MSQPPNAALAAAADKNATGPERTGRLVAVFGAAGGATTRLSFESSAQFRAWQRDRRSNRLPDDIQ